VAAAGKVNKRNLKFSQHFSTFGNSLGLADPFAFGEHRATNAIMDPRHAAALALVGWYLMMPATKKAALEGPSGSWKVSSAHDTAADCEAVRAQGIEILKTAVQKQPNNDAALTALGIATFAQCVATDDPRLRPK
jgi:hypothetical protein